MSTTHTVLEPKLLGFWTRCLREAQHISQDALAASSGLDIRTIQRIEAGNPVSITTRRCLAKGLGYDNPDIFDDPEFVIDIHRILKELGEIQQRDLERQHPDCVRVKAERIQNGETLGRFAEIANGVLLTADDAISHDAKVAAATLFDYIRDLLDFDEASYSDKIGYNKDLETMLREVEVLGTALYAGFRNVRLTGENWADKTPLSFTIGYLTAVPADRVLGYMLVPKRVQLG